MRQNRLPALLAVVLLATLTASAADSATPIAAPDLVFDEADGIVAVQAEHFGKQTLTDKRAWHIVSSKNAPDLEPEGKASAVTVKSGTLPAAFPEVAEAALAPLVLPRKTDGKGAVEISGELKEWHKVTLTLDRPYAHELDNEPNPFTDCNLTVTFTHESGSPSYKVPGYFTADGNAGENSAESGTKWRARLSPDKAGSQPVLKP